ncbi:MAG: hypothetical protein OXN84_04500 [Albidovulum sp.]|nr:hypothetical protein [Albidovulum sp.]
MKKIAWILWTGSQGFAGSGPSRFFSGWISAFGVPAIASCYPVNMVMPGLKGPEVKTIYAAGANWLAGSPKAWAGHIWN